MWEGTFSFAHQQSSIINRHRTRLPEFHAFFPAENAVGLALAVAGAKELHELGHGLACRPFGYFRPSSRLMFFL